MIKNKLKIIGASLFCSIVLCAAYVDVVDQNVVIQGSSEQSLQIKRGGTVGSVTAPIFHLGRIAAGGDNSPNFRVLYSDGSTSETPIINFDNKGIFATIKDGNTGASFESYDQSGDTYPYFRIRNDTAERISFGEGGSTNDNDVDFRRTGTKKAGIAIDSTVQLEATETEIKIEEPLQAPVLTSHPSAPASGYVSFYFYDNGSTVLPYMQESDGTKTAIQ